MDFGQILNYKPYDQVCNYASMQVFKYANMQICKYASMQVCKYPTMQVCKYESMYVCKYASVQVYICLYKKLNKKKERGHPYPCLQDLSYYNINKV